MRNAERPIGALRLTGEGVARVTSAIAWALHFEGPQSIFVSDQARVFALPAGTPVCERWMIERAEWCCGTYALNGCRAQTDAEMMRADISTDLRERLRELNAARRAA